MAMDSKDFRSKLQNLETPYNPEAWSQMEELLNALPVQIENTKDRRIWIWLLLALLLMCTAGVLFWLKSGQVHPSSELTIGDKEIKESVLTEELNSKRTKTQDKELATVQGDQLPLDRHIHTDSTGEVQDEIINETISKEQSASREEKVNSSVEDLNRSQIGGAQQEKLLGNTKSSIDLPQDEMTDTNVVQSKDIENDNNSSVAPSQVVSTSEIVNTENGLSTFQQDKLRNSLSSENQGIADDQQSTSQPLLTEAIMLDMIRKEALIRPAREEALLSDNFQVEIPKSRRLFYTGSLGISDINSNRGYYLGAGVFWDIDKIIGLEPQLTFASAWDINGTSTSFLSSEQELELAAWIHLNLWRVEKHKVSIELAPSLVANWSIARGETLREYRGINANYKAGLSYTFFMPNGNGLGLKGAISRFDSGFVALRYFKKF